MANQPALFLADLLAEHFEEFAFLWGQRRTALHSPLYTARELTDLETRIEGHVDALVVAGERTPDLLAAGLGEEEPGAVFLAAYPLLRLGRADTTERVFQTFALAENPQREGLVEALCHAAPAAAASRLALALAIPGPLASAAARVLAFRSPADLTAQQLASLVRAAELETRVAAWRTVALSGQPLPTNLCLAAWRDPDAALRREALWAAAWTGCRELLIYCRSLRGAPGPDRWEIARLLAILGSHGDLEPLRALAATPELGPRRFALLGTFGHPGGVEDLLAAMAGKDVRAAVEAGKAFARITGHDVGSSERVELPTEDGEDVEEVVLPSADRARAHWDAVCGRFAQGTRWSRGADLSRGAGPEVLRVLDRESLYEECLRARFAGRWQGRLAELEVFPQPAVPGVGS